MLLQNKEREEVINRGLHDLAHFSLSDVRVPRIAVLCGTVLPRVNTLYRAIAERQRYERFCLSGDSRLILGEF